MASPSPWPASEDRVRVWMVPEGIGDMYRAVITVDFDDDWSQEAVDLMIDWAGEAITTDASCYGKCVSVTSERIDHAKREKA
jgi:hypothetical protein